jgi:uncharacterized membrane protein YhaH (DUF805 family)
MSNKIANKTKKSLWNIIVQDLSFFNVSGRMGRLKYATFSVAWIVLTFLPLFIAKTGGSNRATALISTCVYIACVINLLFLSIKRIKDFQPPKWSFPILFLGNFVLPILLLVPGTKSDNIYGKKTEESKLRLFSALVLMIGLLFMLIRYVIPNPMLAG